MIALATLEAVESRDVRAERMARADGMIMDARRENTAALAVGDLRTAQDTFWAWDFGANVAALAGLVSCCCGVLVRDGNRCPHCGGIACVLSTVPEQDRAAKVLALIGRA